MNPKRLYYEVHGDRGPYVLLVHGLLSSRAQWFPNLKTLSSFCRPVVVELFGHGRSPSLSAHEVYLPENYAREFETIRKDLGIENWFICGQSMGASLTLLYSIIYPESVIAQAFTNSRSALCDLSENKYNTSVAERLKTDGRKVIDDFPMHPARSRRLPQDVKHALLEDINRMNLIGFKNTMLHTAMNIQVYSRLSQIKVPTLLIVGRYEKQFIPFIKVAEKSIPNLTVLMLDGGHAVNIDAPVHFSQAIKGLITDHIK